LLQKLQILAFSQQIEILRQLRKVEVPLQRPADSLNSAATIFEIDIQDWPRLNLMPQKSNPRSDAHAELVSPRALAQARIPHSDANGGLRDQALGDVCLGVCIVLLHELGQGNYVTTTLTCWRSARRSDQVTNLRSDIDLFRHIGVAAGTELL
jgi:hypothetical protein